MKKYLLLLMCSVCGNLSLFSQHTPTAYETACQDTLLYRQLQLDKTIAPTTDLKLMSKYYMALKQGYKKNPEITKLQRIRPLPLVIPDFKYEYNPDNLADMGNEEKKAPFYDGEFERLKYAGYLSELTPQLVKMIKGDSVEHWNVQMAAAYNQQHGIYPANARNVKRFHRAAEMKDLRKRLETFRANAKNLPIFFSDIDTKFKGNIRKYVRHLYGKTIMGNNDVMSMFTKNPTMEAIQNDLGVQYAVGLALYELWIKDVREGKINK